MIRMKNLIHPGEILLEEFLKPMNISQNKLAMDIHVPAPRINAIAKGTRSITADTALRLGKYFGTGPEFWLNLQSNGRKLTPFRSLLIPESTNPIQHVPPGPGMGIPCRAVPVRV